MNNSVVIKTSQKENQDIIDFRHKLIHKSCSKHYIFGVVCNDNHTNVMTEERRKVLSDVLIMFNNHFGALGYDLG